jgi:anti-anti-sigma factor
MDFNIESRKNCTVIQILAEKLDTHIAPALKSELVLVSGKGEKNIILGLEKCQYCDSSGLSAILDYVKMQVVSSFCAVLMRLWKDLSLFLSSILFLQLPEQWQMLKK